MERGAPRDEDPYGPHMHVSRAATSVFLIGTPPAHAVTTLLTLLAASVCAARDRAAHLAAQVDFLRTAPNAWRAGAFVSPATNAGLQMDMASLPVFVNVARKVRAAERVAFAHRPHESS